MRDVLPLLHAPAVSRDLLAGGGVSADLLPRLSSPMVRGRHWPVPAPAAQPAALPHPGQPLRRAYREHRVPRRTLLQTLTPWDLLLPALHPPLALDAGQTIEL